MLHNLAVVVAVLITAILIYAATKPNVFRIKRSLRINAPPEKIFPLIGDFRGWTKWSPYERRDPQMQRTYGAVTGGKGATYAWDGNKDVGQGRMEILESAPSTKVVIKLDFIKPFEAHNTAEFTLEPAGSAASIATTVTWAMYGRQSFMSKVMSLFINMDKMIGKDFETGLTTLKAIAEK